MSEPNEDLSDREIVEKLVQAHEERQNLVEFRWCREIRKAGHHYRETDDVAQVAKSLDLDKDRTKEALKLFPAYSFLST